MFELYGISSQTMFFEWVNEVTVWESCTSYAIIRVITVRVMRSLLYTVPIAIGTGVYSSYSRCIQFLRRRSNHPQKINHTQIYKSIPRNPNHPQITINPPWTPWQRPFTPGESIWTPVGNHCSSTNNHRTCIVQWWSVWINPQSSIHHSVSHGPYTLPTCHRPNGLKPSNTNTLYDQSLGTQIFSVLSEFRYKRLLPIGIM